MRVFSTKYVPKQAWVVWGASLGALLLAGLVRAESASDCGTAALPDRATFEFYADHSDVPGALEVWEVKFLIVGLQNGQAQLHFMNTRHWPYHYDFARFCLGWTVSLWTFNRQTYFTDQRHNLAGSLVAYDAYEPNDGPAGVYAVEFWPTDPVRFTQVQLAVHLIRQAVGFPADRIVYHPAGRTQEELYQQERFAYEQADFRVLTSDELFGRVRYGVLNPGLAYGRLHVVRGSEPVSVRDIVVFDTLPNSLSHVSGILTSVPQTPLSHINLLARQNHTPNAFLRGSAADPNILALDGQTVRYQVDANGVTLTPADPNEAAAYLEALRPTEATAPRRDLSLAVVTPLEQLGFADAARVGAKAANVAELGHFMPAGVVPQGYAVPFAFYDRFMRFNGLYQAATDMMADPDFQADPAIRSERLAAFRHRIRNAGWMPPDMLAALAQMQQSFPAGTALRCRSSTNNEDLPGFNGAGLYESVTHHPDEGHIARSIRQVWASLWTERAYEERWFYRVDHLQTAMGVLVHPNYSNELANGVAVSQNLYDPAWPGATINVQVGEQLVTHPPPHSVPEEILVAELLGQTRYEIILIGHSNLVEPGRRILTDEQVVTLADWLALIQRHFAPLYGQPDLAMEVEFKLTEQGTLVIKQARPWIP